MRNQLQNEINCIMKKITIGVLAILLTGCAIVNNADSRNRAPIHYTSENPYKKQESSYTKDSAVDTDRIIASVEKLAKEIIAERDSVKKTQPHEQLVLGKSPVMPTPPPLVTVPAVCMPKARNYVPLPIQVDTAALETALSRGDSKTVITVLIKNIEELNTQLRKAKVLETTRNREIVRSCGK